MTTRRRALGLVVAGLWAWAGCDRPPQPTVRRLVVFAAASLREPMVELAERFEVQRPGVEVALQFAGSQQLRAQLEFGAEADVFVSADPTQLQALCQSDIASSGTPVAYNGLALAVPLGSRLRRFEDLPSAERIVLAVPQSPIGRYAQEALARADRIWGPGFAARVEQRVVSRELHARQVLLQVALGQADAGMVYRTDVAAARQRVALVEVPAAVQVRATYEAAVLRASPGRNLAEAFVASLVAPAAQAIWVAAGFVPASAAGGQK